MKTVTAIAFDLDGTLLDTVPDSHAALNRVLIAEGLRSLTLEEVRHVVGHGARSMIEKAFFMAGSSRSGAGLDALVQRYLAAYLEDPASHTVIYDGAVQVLTELRQRGLVFGICTNKPRITTHAVLAALELDRFFSAVVCPEDVPYRKPDGRHVLATLQSLRALPAQSIFVGDSEIDMAAAVDAGVASILVTWGYPHVPVRDIPADAVIERFADLPAALVRLDRPRISP